MRLMPSVLLLVATTMSALLLTGCAGDEPAETAGAEGSAAEADAPAAAPPAADQATASGYVQIVVEGESLRFEHLPPNDNELNPLALEMHAQRSSDDEEGVFILLMHSGLDDLEYPHVFDGFDQEEMDAGETPYRMQINYKDAEGRLYGLQRNDDEPTGVRIDRLDGRRIEGELLPGKLVHSPFEPEGLRFEGGTFSIELADRS